MDSRYYDVEIAKRLGINAAVIYEFIAYWCAKNGIERDGLRWIFYKITDFEEHFPDISRRTIQRSLRKLESEGLIKVGCFNKMKFDRTRWYADLSDHIDSANLTPSNVPICHHDSANLTPSDSANLTPSDSANLTPPITTKEITKNNTNKSSIGKTPRFIPPTVEEVRTYCEERHNNIDAEHFVNYYESIGWMRGKTKIKDWRACVITWEKKDKASKPVKKQEGNEFDQLLREEGYI